MKTSTLFLFVIALLIGIGAKSQEAEHSTFKNSHSITFSNYAFKPIEKGFYMKPIQAFEIGYILNAQPKDSQFYCEIGGNVMYAYGNVSEEEAWGIEGSIFMNLLSINIPFNFGYNIKISDNFTISPYIGFYQRVNITGNLSVTLKDNNSSVSVNTHLFYDEISKAKIHQVGINAGLNFKFKKFHCGYFVKYDFLEFAENTRVLTWGLNYAYTF